MKVLQLFSGTTGIDHARNHVYFPGFVEVQ